MPDINEYALAMELSLSHVAALNALDKVSAKVAEIDAAIGKLGRKFAKSLAVTASVKLDVDAAAKAAFDDEVLANVASVIKKAISAGFAKAAPLSIEPKLKRIGAIKPKSIALKPVMKALPAIEVEASIGKVNLPPAMTVDVVAGISIDAAAKAAFDERLRRNVTETIRSAAEAGFASVKVPEVEANVQAGAMAVEARPELDVAALPPIQVGAEVDDLTIRRSAKAALDNVLHSNITQVMADGIRDGIIAAVGQVDLSALQGQIKGAAQGAVRGVAITGVDASGIEREMMERVERIRNLKIQLMFSSTVDESGVRTYHKALQALWAEADALRQSVAAGVATAAAEVQLREIDDAVQHAYTERIKALDDYARRAEEVGDQMTDLEHGREEMNAENLRYYIRQGDELVRMRDYLRDLEAAGQKIPRDIQAQRDQLEAMGTLFEQRREYWRSELDSAKRITAQMQRMTELEKALTDVAEEGPIAVLARKLTFELPKTLSLFKRTATALRALDLGLLKHTKQEQQAAAAEKGLAGAVARSVRGFKQADAGMAKEAGGRLAEGMQQGLEEKSGGIFGGIKRLFGRVYDVLFGEGKRIQTAAKGATITPPRVDPVGARLRAYLDGVASSFKAFGSAMAAIPWAAIAKFAVAGTVLLALVGGMVALSAVLASLGTKGIVSLLAISAAAIAFAIALKIVSAALIALGTAGAVASVAIPILLTIAAIMATLALTIYAMTAFTDAAARMFEVFISNVGAGFAFVGFLAAAIPALAAFGVAMAGFSVSMLYSMGLLSLAMLLGGPATTWLTGLAATFGKLASAMASLGPDAGAKVRDVAGAFRELAKAKIGAGTMAGMKLAAVGLLALGSAAATTAPQMLAVVSAGDAIMDMTGRIIDMEADFDRAAAIMSKFGQRMGEAFDKVATAAEAGPFSAEAETRAETITTVKVKDEVARNAAAGSRQIGDILTSIRDVLTSVDAKMDPATVLDIKKILDANLPAESAKGAPVDDINRWKLG